MFYRPGKLNTNQINPRICKWKGKWNWKGNREGKNKRKGWLRGREESRKGKGREGKKECFLFPIPI